MLIAHATLGHWLARIQHQKTNDCDSNLVRRKATRKLRHSIGLPHTDRSCFPVQERSSGGKQPMSHSCPHLPDMQQNRPSTKWYLWTSPSVSKRNSIHKSSHWYLVLARNAQLHFFWRYLRYIEQWMIMARTMKMMMFSLPTGIFALRHTCKNSSKACWVAMGRGFIR